MCKCSRFTLLCSCFGSAVHKIVYESAVSDQHELIRTPSLWITRWYILSVFGLVISMITSDSNCHTIVHIYSYGYNHTRTTIQWSCTLGHETRPWKALGTYNVQVLLRQATNMNWYTNWYRHNCVGWHAATIWLYMVLWSSSWHHAHTVIQSYTYKHIHTNIHIQPCNDVAHGYIRNISMKSCTYPWSLRPHRCSSTDWLSDPWLCACHPALICLREWWRWLNVWPLRLLPTQFTRLLVISSALPPGSVLSWFSKCWRPRLPLRFLVSAPVTLAI